MPMPVNKTAVETTFPGRQQSGSRLRNDKFKMDMTYIASTNNKTLQKNNNKFDTYGDGEFL